MISRKYIQLVFLVLFCLLTLAGCKEQQEKEENISSPLGHRDEASQGPLTVILGLSAKEISVAQSLVLTLQVDVPEDFNVSFPEFTSSVGDFTLNKTAPARKELIKNGIQIVQSWTLSPFLPGDYLIPSMTIRAQHKDPEQPENTITIPGRTVPVSSFLDPDEKEPQLSDISAPLSLPVPSYYYVLAALAVIACLGLVFYLIKKYYTRDTTKTKDPAHIRALGKINTLLQQTPAEENFALFYSRLSLILRHYIEERFSLKAAEQTTEEFLFSLGQAPVFSMEQKELLQNFLLRSDLIKFARVQPNRVETMESVEICRSFILATGDPEIKHEGGKP